MVTWFGPVNVSAGSQRAFMLDTPSAISRRKLVSSVGGEVASKAGKRVPLSPSTLTWITN
jgi:hypothetical protein